MKLCFVILVVVIVQLINGDKQMVHDDLIRQAPCSDSVRSLEITLPIFSSIPDPQWTINLRLSKYSEVRNSYDAAKHKGNLYEKERMPVILGYKGFLLRECRRIRPLLAYGQNTKKLQRDLLETVPEGELDQPLKSRILNEIQSKRSSVWQNVKSYKRGAPPPTGPPIEYENIWGKHGFVFTEASKEWWSDEERIINNCYNYANNVYTDGATIQSGAAVPNRIAIPTTGHLEGQFSEIIKERSVQDGLKVIPGADMPNKPWSSNTNIVALFVTPENAERRDMHWYRLDRNTNRWSHKPGRLPATDRDKATKVITDPRNADHGIIDYQFVCFMKTYKNKALKNLGLPPPAIQIKRKYPLNCVRPETEPDKSRC